MNCVVMPKTFRTVHWTSVTVALPTQTMLFGLCVSKIDFDNMSLIYVGCLVKVVERWRPQSHLLRLAGVEVEAVCLLTGSQPSQVAYNTPYNRTNQCGF